MQLELKRPLLFFDIESTGLNISSDGIIELNYEVRLRDDDSSFVNELQKTDGISRVVLVSYNGDYMV